MPESRADMKKMSKKLLKWRFSRSEVIVSRSNIWGQVRNMWTLARNETLYNLFFWQFVTNIIKAKDKALQSRLNLNFRFANFGRCPQRADGLIRRRRNFGGFDISIQVHAVIKHMTSIGTAAPSLRRLGYCLHTNGTNPFGTSIWWKMITKSHFISDT